MRIIFFVIFFFQAFHAVSAEQEKNVGIDLAFKNALKPLEIEALQGETVYYWFEYENSTDTDQSYHFSMSDASDVDNESDVAVELKHLLAWYKDSNAKKSIHHGRGRILVDELLVNDPELINVDKQKKINSIRFEISGKTKYLSEEALEEFPQGKDGRIRMNAKKYYIADSKVLLSRNLKAGEKKKLLMTFKVDDNAISENKHLQLIMTSTSGDTRLPITLTIKPYKIVRPPLEYSVFYRGLLDTLGNTVSSERKTASQLSHEFKHIASASYVNPVIYQSVKPGREFRAYMDYRKQYLPSNEKYYFTDTKIIRLVKSGNIGALDKALKKIKKILGDLPAVFMIDDEPRGDQVKTRMAMHEVFDRYGFEVFVTGRVENFSSKILANTTYVLAYDLNEDAIAKIREDEAAVFSYANPQVGVIDPASIRFNYGLNLLKNNFDGAMLYAYQDSRGSVWSDFDGRYRDHMFSYPTSDGILNTVSWIAFHQGIMDAGYYQALQDSADQLALSQCGNEQLFNELTSLLADLSEIQKGHEDVYRQQIRIKIDKANRASKEC